MTKADMVEIIVNDAVQKYKAMVLMESVLGEDSPAFKEYEREWGQATSLLFKLKLEDIYLEKVPLVERDEPENA